MRKVLPEKLEAGRLTTGPMASHRDWGAYGAFFVQGPCGEELKIVASSGADADDKVSQGWEHVSISTRRRQPNWREMCFVKDLFWDEEECVIQFHPPKSEYVNAHPYCLHLWKYRLADFPRPPTSLVGPVGLTPLSADEVSRVRRELGLRHMKKMADKESTGEIK